MDRYIPSRGLRTVMGLLVLIGGATAIAALLFRWLPAVWSWTETNRDVHVYYLGALNVLEGKPLYRPYPEYGPYMNASPGHLFPRDRFFNPPTVFVAAVPFARLGPQTFAHIGELLILASFLTYAACLAHLATGRVTWQPFLLATLVLLCLPGTVTVMKLGNIAPILWALFGLALVSLQLRGGMFAAIALVKIHTLWPLAMASVHDRWRIYLPAAIVLLAGLLIGCLAPGGFGAWVDWLRYAVPSEPAQGSFNRGNVSITFAGLRLARLLGWDYVIGPLPVWARLYLTVFSLGAPLATMRLVRKLDHVLQYACVTSAAVLFAPLCWSCYLAYPLAAVALACRRLLQAGEGQAAAAQPVAAEAR